MLKLLQKVLNALFPAKLPLNPLRHWMLRHLGSNLLVKVCKFCTLRHCGILALRHESYVSLLNASQDFDLGTIYICRFVDAI